MARNDEVALDDLARSLADLGYSRTDRVEARGEFAVRGGIVDVFPAQDEEPVRLDFWGDTVEDIRVILGRHPALRGPRRSAHRLSRPGGAPDPLDRDRPPNWSGREPWAASTWDRIAEGQLFPGIESWLPWLAEPISLIDAAPVRPGLLVVEPTRALDRARELIKEETELAEALAPPGASRPHRPAPIPPCSSTSRSSLA